MIKKTLTGMLLGTALLIGNSPANSEKISKIEETYGTKIEVPITKYEAVESKPKLLDYSLKEVKKGPVITMDLVEAIAKVESENNSAAVSKAGAEGLMQIMPETWQAHCSYLGSPFDSKANKKCGIKYLNWLEQQISQGYPYWESLDVEDKRKFVLAAYNGGLGKLRDSFDWNPNRMHLETRNYIRKVRNNI